MASSAAEVLAAPTSYRDRSELPVVFPSAQQQVDGTEDAVDPIGSDTSESREVAGTSTGSRGTAIAFPRVAPALIPPVPQLAYRNSGG